MWWTLLVIVACCLGRRYMQRKDLSMTITPPPPEIRAWGEDGAAASFPRQPRQSHLHRQQLDQLIEAITEETRPLCQISSRTLPPSAWPLPRLIHNSISLHNPSETQSFSQAFLSHYGVADWNGFKLQQWMYGRTRGKTFCSEPAGQVNIYRGCQRESERDKGSDSRPCEIPSKVHCTLCDFFCPLWLLLVRLYDLTQVRSWV